MTSIYLWLILTPSPHILTLYRDFTYFLLSVSTFGDPTFPPSGWRHLGKNPDIGDQVMFFSNYLD